MCSNKDPVQFSSVAQSCPNLCDPMDCSTPGLPVHHQLPEFTQTHVHWVGDAIQLSHPLLSPSLPAFNFSQHLGLFQWVSSSHQVAKVLELQLHHQSFQWILRMISYRIDCFDLLAVQRTLKNLLQHHAQGQEGGTTGKIPNNSWKVWISYRISNVNLQLTQQTKQSIRKTGEGI